MNTAKIHLIDKTFQSQHSGKCNLLIKISSKRLSYAIIDQSNDQLKVLFDAPLDGGLKTLKILVDKDPFFKFSYNKIKISVQTSKYTFIPKEIYSDSDLDSYALFVYPVLESDILVKEIRSVKLKNIMAIDKSLRQYLISSFADPVIFNQVNPLIEASLKVYQNTTNTLFVIQFNSDSFEALVLKDNNLLFYNLFNPESPNEFNYFLLGIIRDLQLKNIDTDIILSGEIDENGESYKCIQKYFSNISFADSGLLIRQPRVFREVPAHQLFSLISLNVCE